MKKIIPCIALSLSLLTGTVFAAPLTDFEKGKFSVDIGTTHQKFTLDSRNLDIKEKKQWGFDLGITAGLNDKIALQYKYQKTDTILLQSPYNVNFNELNLLYSLTPNTYAFAGARQASLGYAYYNHSGANKVTAQIGVTSVAKIATKVDGWATVAFGPDNFSYEIGAGYPLANNADLNLFYRYKKVKDMVESASLGNEPFPITSKGLGASVTFRF